MCIAVYIGANKELPLIKESDFHVEVARSTEKFQHILAASYIYYAGSFEGCGCGFRYESDTQLRQELARTKDIEEHKLIEAEWHKQRKSVELLSEYLAQAVIQEGSVDLYITWEGDEGSPLRYEKTITPDYFGGESFEIEEQGLLKVVPKNKPKPA